MVNKQEIDEDYLEELREYKEYITNTFDEDIINNDFLLFLQKCPLDKDKLESIAECMSDYFASRKILISDIEKVIGYKYEDMTDDDWNQIRRELKINNLLHV